MIEMHKRNVGALAGQDAPVVQVDRGRRRVHGEEERLSLLRGAPRLLAADPVLPLGAAERDGGREVAVRIGQVEHGTRRAGDLEDLFEDLGAEAGQVVDGRRRGKHGVHRGLDVPFGERADPFAVEIGGLVEVTAEIPDLIVGLIEEPGGRLIGGQLFERPRRGAGGHEDPAIDVGEQPEQTGQDQGRQESERRDGPVAAVAQPLFREGLAAREAASELGERIAQLLRGGRDQLVVFRARAGRALRAKAGDGVVRGARVDLFGGFDPFQRPARSLAGATANGGQRRTEGGAAGMVAGQVIALPGRRVAVEGLLGVLQPRLRVVDPLAQVDRPLDRQRHVGERENGTQRIGQPRGDDCQARKSVDPKPSTQGRVQSRRGRSRSPSGSEYSQGTICHTMSD